MTWWAVGAAVVGGVISASNQSDATQQAANTQAVSTERGIAEQQRQFDLTRADYAQTRDDFKDYRKVGVSSLLQAQSEIGTLPTSAEVMSDPGYQFGLSQGQQALDRKAAAAGGRVSGASLKAASEYATNYATVGYDKAYQRRQDRLNRLQALAGIGQTATAGSAANGAGSGQVNAITGLISGQGDAAAAAQLARGNIWGNNTNQITAAAGRVGGYGNNSPTYYDPAMYAQAPGQYDLNNVQYG